MKIGYLSRVVLCNLLLLFVACPLPVQARRHVVIAGVDSIPPIEFKDEKGVPAGFNVELVGTAIERLGYDYDISLGNVDSLVSRFNRGEVDVILGGRQPHGLDPMLVNQSNMTVLQYLSIASRKDDNYSSMGDLKGKTIGIVRDTNVEQYIIKGDSSYRSNIVHVPTPEEGILALADGKFDAVIMRFYVARYILEKNEITNVVLRPVNVPPVEQRVVANDPNLAMEITVELNRMRRDGTYDSISKKWLSAPNFYERYFYMLVVGSVVVFSVVVYFVVVLVRKIHMTRKMLVKERDRLAVLMEAGRFMGCVVDLQRMEITYISSAGEAVYTCGVAEALEPVYPKDRKKVLQSIEDARDGKGVNGEIVVRIKTNDATADGDGYHYFAIFSKELRNENGDIQLYWLRKDVDEQRRNSIELARYHARMDVALKHTGISQWDYDVVKRLVTVRNGYNMSEDVVLGVDEYIEFMPAFKPVFDVMDEAEKDEFVQDVTFKYPGSDDTRYATMMVRAMAKDDDGKVVLYTGIRKDNTDLVKIQKDLEGAKEKAEAADKLKSEFLDNMSHEIRTPLNAIVGFASLLEGASEDDRKRYVDIINSGSEQLLSLINDVLDMSSIEAGTLELYPETFDMTVEFDYMAGCMDEKLANGSARVELVVENPYKSCLVTLDKRWVRRIINIFMTNAIKNTRSGYVKMSYSYDEVSDMVISVEDTGIGIEEKNFDKVFRRFEKIDNFVQGSGLELALLKAFADRNGDKVGFVSHVGEGSTFYYEIRCKAVVAK